MRCEETDENLLEPVKLLHQDLLKETFTVSTNLGYITKVLTLISAKNR